MIKKIIILPILLAIMLLTLSSCGGGTSGSNDDDGDSVINIQDNCPEVTNTDQLNTDNDDKGNVCDDDDDNDGVSDGSDEFPLDELKATSISNAHRLLLQATFGPTEKDINEIISIGTDAWIEKQLSMPSGYDEISDDHKTHLQRTIEIAQLAEPSKQWIGENDIFNESISQPTAKDHQMSAWWENALGHPIYTRHGSDQLRQRVAYSFSQLLVTSALHSRLRRRAESLAHYNDILAKNAFGNYRDLLDEVARSPAMGVYLSHQGNQKSNIGKAIRPDENFARELIQLFTIGLYDLNLDGSPDLDGNHISYPDVGSNTVASYTQSDVEELAKVMTGWDLKDNDVYGGTGGKKFRGADYTKAMEFFPLYHEDEIEEGGDGKVTFLRNTFDLNSGIDGSGLDSALDILFNHPNIGPYVSRHLITNLVTSNPSSAYVARVASIFNDNGIGIRGDLKAIVRAVLTDQDARATSSESSVNFGKIKEPILVWTQLLRLFNVRPLDGWISLDKNQAGDPITIDGVYAFNNPEEIFGQAPFRSKSVFNFYMPDYVPSDKYFSDNRFVSPESQIQTDQALIEFNNSIYSFLSKNEKNMITRVDKISLREFAATKSHDSNYVMLVDFDRELRLFEVALDGDNNGDFMNMEKIDANNIPFKQKAVEALLIHLDKLMLGNSMTTSYKNTLSHYLLNANGLESTNKLEQAQHMIRDAVRFITTSSAFIVQK